MNKILHVFYNFLPDLSGSSIRSSGLVSGQLARGMRLVAVSSPFQPGFAPGQDKEEYRGMPLYRAYRPGYPRVSEKGSSIGSRLKKVALFPGFVLTIRRTARREAATFVHAHSTFYCAMAGYLAARSLGLKAVYEFRSLWEERTRNANISYMLQSMLSRWLETVSLSLVDHVVTINESLKSEVVARGIPSSKVTVVPNAVDDGLIELGGSLSLPTRVTRFGYVGNLSAIEGLDLLVDAFRRAFPDGEQVELLFHGIGSYEQGLALIIQAAGDPRIRLCGRFSRNAVLDVYRSLDCVVIPRRRSKISETVTPLKPLEAMAFGRLVGISDVQGLLEVVGEGSNAWTFRADDAADLARGLRRVFEGAFDVAAMARRGREFVARERAWNAVAAAYARVYGDDAEVGTARFARAAGATVSSPP